MTAFEDACACIDRLAEPVGLSPASSEYCASLNPPIESLRVWLGAYAFLVCVSADDATLEHRWTLVQDWLDAVLLRNERSVKGVVDGYLAFILASEPASSVRHTIESDRSICRKYVMWPHKTSNPWSTLACVSALGLPLSESSADESVLPEPDASLRDLWKSVVEPDKDVDAIEAACRI